MTRKHRRVTKCNRNNNEGHGELPRHTRNHRIRYEQNVPVQFANNLVPVNADEQKDRFLRRKLTPEFHLNVPLADLESTLSHSSGVITFTLFREATRILNMVCKRFKCIDRFIEQAFGPRISIDEATVKITEYIKESNLPTSLDVIWCEDLVGSALMCSTGLDKNGNIPRSRKFTMLLKTNEENTYLREKGIVNLMDHEIGTHYHRSYNEGLQPWYGKRDLYGLGPTQSNEAIKIEEGLACIHTVLNSEYPYLGLPALLYYGSCMAEYLPFRDLFEHLGKYVMNEEQRWKHCMRIKRCLPSQDRCGGYGKDQRYFEGAVAILRQQTNTDFQLLMSGKLTLKELERVRRCAQTSAIRLPTFMLRKDKYMRSLRRIANLNGIEIEKRTNDHIQRHRSQSVACDGEKRLSAENAALCSKLTSALEATKIHSRSSSSATSKSSHTNKHSIVKPLCDQAPNNLPHIDMEPRNQPISDSATEIPPDLLVPPIYVHKSSELINANRFSNESDTESQESSSSAPSTWHVLKSRIMQTLLESRLPTKLLTNLSDRSSPNYTSVFSLPVVSTKRKCSSSSDAPVGETDGFENQLQTLNSRGLLVCGCRLFTHGSLRIPAESPQCKSKDHRLKSVAHSQAEQNRTKLSVHSVPLLLELDLQHPIVGV